MTQAKQAKPANKVRLDPPVKPVQLVIQAKPANKAQRDKQDPQDKPVIQGLRAKLVIPAQLVILAQQVKLDILVL